MPKHSEPAFAERGPRIDTSSEVGSLPDNKEGRYEGRNDSESTVWIVWDNTTNNLLGEFSTRQEAEAWREEIRPLGRFGPDGHDLHVYAEPIR